MFLCKSAIQPRYPYLIPIFLLHTGLLLMLLHHSLCSAEVNGGYIRPINPIPLPLSLRDQEQLIEKVLPSKRLARPDIQRQTRQDSPLVAINHSADSFDAEKNASHDHQQMPATSSLDLEAIRLQFQQSERTRDRNANAQSPTTIPTITLESKLATDINNAHREDCMVAHPDGQSLGNVRFVGLLAAIPLMMSAVSGKGCKW